MSYSDFSSNYHAYAIRFWDLFLSRLLLEIGSGEVASSAEPNAILVKLFALLGKQDASSMGSCGVTL
jgi:hypothetical protein